MTPEETDADLPECPEVSSGGVGWQWPPAGLGALSVAVQAWDFLNEVTIIFITCTIVWPQINNREGTQPQPINRRLDLRFTEHGPTHQNKTQFPPQSVSPIRKLP